MKIVYNARFGGFGLSLKAIIRYAEIKGITIYPESFGNVIVYWTVPESERDGSRSLADLTLLPDADIHRNDPALVQVVEELGEEANGHGANLRIADVPPGERYRIDYDDGWERVMTIDDYYWSVAE